MLKTSRVTTHKKGKIKYNSSGINESAGRGLTNGRRLARLRKKIERCKASVIRIQSRKMEKTAKLVENLRSIN